MQALSRVSLAMVCLLALIGCGGGGESPNLTPEQRTFVRQSQDQFDKVKAEAEKLIAEHRAKAEGDTAKALDDLNASLTKTQNALSDLKFAAGEAWAKKKPVFEAALRDLVAKLAEAGAKVKVGNFKLPGLG